MFERIEPQFAHGSGLKEGGGFHLPATPEKRYVGERLIDGTCEVRVETPPANRGGQPIGEPLPLCTEIRAHSPTGFAWGYGGSGPAQLALALLVDALGDRESAERHYQAFKWAYVSHWTRCWTITAREIRDFVATREMGSSRDEDQLAYTLILQNGQRSDRKNRRLKLCSISSSIYSPDELPQATTNTIFPRFALQVSLHRLRIALLESLVRRGFSKSQFFRPPIRWASWLLTGLCGSPPHPRGTLDSHTSQRISDRKKREASLPNATGKPKPRFRFASLRVHCRGRSTRLRLTRRLPQPGISTTSHRRFAYVRRCALDTSVLFRTSLQ